MCEDIIKVDVKEIVCVGILSRIGWHRVGSSAWLRLKQLRSFWSRKKTRSACQFLKKNAV